ncbi:MAG: molybdate ABC transporter substrate-binding protein [Pirellulaceae bacterium]|nr:molybdate ABC transporter substrate-binding protein [Planctomycetales bacterium]
MLTSCKDLMSSAGKLQSLVKIVFAVALVVSTSCGPAPPSTARTKVTVLAAASMTDAINEVGRQFSELHHNVEVVVNTGPSNGLAQQIMAGAPADIFLSANEQWADAIASRGLAAETVDLLSNALVLIVPRGNPAQIAGLDDLRKPEVLRVAIAGENVPAGIYAQQALDASGTFELLRRSGRLARGSDVRVTLGYVERGEAEAGVVYATDARISDQVEVIAQLDPSRYGPIIYPAVLLESASEKQAARMFFQHLSSAAARAVFEKYGFFAPSVATTKRDGV